MAHFVYPAGTPLGTVPAGYVLLSSDYQTTIQQVFKSINGDDGGTWAPGAFITVGGSGFQFTGTGHSLAASARLTVQPGAEIRLLDTASAVTMPILRVNGSAGDILLYVEAHASKLEVKSGALAQINNGGFLNVYGALTLISSGPGTFTAQMGTTTTFNSGATVVFNNSDNTVNSNFKIASGAFLTVQSGGTLTLTGNMSVGGASTITFANGGVVAGIVTRTGVEIRSGTSGRTAYRTAYALPNADADCTVDYDRYAVPLTITASRVYTVRHTGTVPRVGERIKFSRTGTTSPSATYAVSISREDGTVIFLFGAQRQGFCEVEWDGSSWVLIAGVSVASGTSGCYNDVW